MDLNKPSALAAQSALMNKITEYTTGNGSRVIPYPVNMAVMGILVVITYLYIYIHIYEEKPIGLYTNIFNKV